ncbi:ACP S-malonyltransferase [Clostridium estertheticum]|uniref:ACP S-malonyltransferase n=1 Tax=Clostridium estertheticum TaxID=238834 RepID=UPI001C6E133F|nr:ACP S-malonyltransferase [Clostridium estertheticum]MBW9154629.1 ACP S-malonyltransferase [Clostridium estertheticum]WLC86538.1 ACP S-malonyltransferase [Clostridium estertheticum]
MKKVALLFPGQGSQYIGMGKTFYDGYPIAKETFEEANDVLGFDIRKLCFQGDMEKLTMTENTQPAILTMGVAMFRVYMKEIGIEPSYLAGHSLGEIIALSCAGAIHFKDAVKMVHNRGKFMQEATAFGTGSMAVISGLNWKEIEDECKIKRERGKLVVISNYNACDQVVISGYKEAVKEVATNLYEKGGRITPLNVSAPFHSPLMKLAAEKFEIELTKYKYSKLKWPVMSNITALPYEDSSRIIENLKKQIVEPVKWQAIIDYMERNGVKIGIELGPQEVLKNLMKKNSNRIKVFSYDKKEDVQLLESMGKDNKMRVLTKSMAIVVCTKNNNWDNEEYQKGVIEPYRKIKEIQMKIEKEGKEPIIEQMREALEMMRSVFITKGTPKEEQIERFNQVFNETGTRHLFPNFMMDVDYKKIR